MYAPHHSGARRAFGEAPADSPREKAIVPAARSIRVLLVEDCANDAQLMVHELGKSGFEPEWERVETEAEFVAQLGPAWDIILADYSLPQFNGLDALLRLQEAGLDIPFIIVSGAIGDELAVRCIKQGVTDYLLKDRMQRLGLAVSNALAEKQLRRERRQVEEQLRHAQRMESIGWLAAGIAHDFDNLLTVINGYVEALLDAESHPPETLHALKEVYMAGERATNLTRQLLFLGGRRPIVRWAVDLNEIVSELASLLRRLIGAPIRLDLKLAPARVIIEADATMMEQVLINLVVNARDAMSSGRITIGSQVVELASEDLGDRPAARAGSFARLWVRDTGSGIAPELLPRIFDPFFTTKKVGKGTGLGLATLFNIVQQHQGWVEVMSDVGVGTTFNVFLPLAGPAVPSAPKSPEIDRNGARGGETILVVEDETSVREFAVAVLKSYGYRTLQAKSGVDALEVWNRHCSRIDLLLTDVVMPDEVSGPDLAARLQAEKPALQVIFASGYTPEMMGRPFRSQQSARLVGKPYRPRVLAHAVREVLDATKAAPVAANSKHSSALKPFLS